MFNLKHKLGVRHRHYAIVFLTLVLYSGIQASLSVAIVAIRGDEPISDIEIAGYDWTNPDIVLSAYFWANFIPLFTGPKLRQLCSPKWLSLFAMLVGSIFNLAIPTMAVSLGSTGIIICRVIQGLCQGFLYPSMNSLIKKWSVVGDRSRIMNMLRNGSILGTAVCMPLSSLMIASKTGWPTVFYVYGATGIIWAIVFAVSVRNLPSSVENLSETEMEMFEGQTDEASNNLPAPWSSIATSLPVWAILIADIGHTWGVVTLLTQMPTYLHAMMDYDIEENGEIVALPYVAQLVISLITVPLTDKLLAKEVISTTKLRKIMNSLGLFLPGISLLTLAYLDSSGTDGAVACLIVAVGTSVIAQSGYLINVVDLAPNHFASLNILLLLTTTVVSILAPLTVSFLGNDKNDPILWRYVFLLAAIINIICGLFYNFFASGKDQKWNSRNSTEVSEDFWKRFTGRLSRMKCLKINSKNCTKIYDYITMKK